MQLSWASGPMRSSTLVLRGSKKRSSALSTVVQARKQAETSKPPAITAEDDVPQVAPADLDRLRDLTKGQLPHQVAVPLFGTQDDKVELATRLLNDLIGQESAINGHSSSEATGTVAEPAATGRRGRRTSRKATAEVEPTSDNSTAVLDPPATETAALAAAAGTQSTRRGRKTSRRVSSVVSEQPDEASAPDAAAASQEQEHHEDLQPATASSRRGRRTSRKTTAVDPAATETPESAAARAAIADLSTSNGTGVEPAGRRARKASRISSTLEPAESSTSPVIEASVADHLSEVAPARRGRKTSRKSSVIEPIEAVADSAGADTALAKHTKPGRKQSRKSSIIDPIEQSLSAAVEAPVAAATESPVQDATVTPAKRGRKSCRQSSGMEAVEAPSAAAESQVQDATITPAKRGRKSSRKSSVIEPVEAPAAAATSATVSTTPTQESQDLLAPTKRTRRTSRKSSVVDSADTAAVAAAVADLTSAAGAYTDVTAAVDAAVPAQRSRARSSTRTSSNAAAAEPTASAAAAKAPNNGATKAKRLAQQLAKKTLATPAAAATVPVAAAAVTTAAALETAVVAAPAIPALIAEVAAPADDDRGSWVNDQLYAGSQAQSDSLFMENTAAAESSDDTAAGTYEEVLAQVAAAEEAGLADETQLTDPAAADAVIAAAVLPAAVEALPSNADTPAAVMTAQQLMPSFVEDLVAAEKARPDHVLSAAADQTALDGGAAAAGKLAAAAAAIKQQQLEVADISAAVVECFAESPLGEDEEPDVTLAAFDHLAVEVPAPVDETAKADDMPGQALGLPDIEAAVEEPYDRAQSATPLEEAEEADEALTAFDHMVVDSTVAAAPRQPSLGLVDIAAAVDEEPAAAEAQSLDTDEEPDQALTVFDHAELSATTAADAAEYASAGEAEAVATAVEAAVSPAPAPVGAMSSSFAGDSSSSDDAPEGLAGLFKGWIAAILKMFADWQKALTPK